MAPQDVALQHLGYSLGSLRSLPQYAREDDPVYPQVRGWCLEAFYMHARVAADFFVKMPVRDFTARSYLPGWRLQDAAAREVLDHAWAVASKQIAHLSADRILGPDDVPELTHGQGLSVIVEAAGTAAWQFVTDFRDRFPGRRSVDVLLR